MYTCQFCNRKLVNAGAVGSHEPYCMANPNRKIRSRSSLAGAKKGSIPWCKGKELSIEHKTNLRLSLLGKTTGLGSTPEKEELRIKRIKLAIQKNPNSGGLRKGSGRGVKGYYESPTAGKVYLRSSYETRYAMWLDSNLIKWRQPLEAFEYEYDGKVRRYYPDFYLIDTDEYIELKGFKTKQDEAKWKTFPKKLRILYGKDIEKLEKCSNNL